MKTITERLTDYAACHRDRRNIATHFVGIPLITLAVAVLLSRPAFELTGLALSPALVAGALIVAFYLRLDIGTGIIMAVLISLALAFGTWAAGQPTLLWLTIGITGLVAGFALQFIGHHLEGRKPAFADDLMGLLIGPLFLVVEVMFAFGLHRDMQRRIETVVGPTRVG